MNKPVQTLAPLPTILADVLPLDLLEQPRWLVWKFVRRGEGKPTKVPYNARTGRKADVTDAATWATFSAALAAYRQKPGRYAGVGFVLGDGISGVDLDACREPETGELAPWALAIVRELAGYAEVSPSGTGVHVWLRGALPPGGRRRGSIEMYEQGRFFTITGDTLADSGASDARALADRSEALAALHARIFTPIEPRETPARSTAGARRRSAPLAPMQLADSELILKAHNARNGADFARVWSGDTSGYPSASEADMALIRRLSFWVGPDAARIDALYRQSGMYATPERARKWDSRRGSSTWGAQLIETVLATPGNSYTPPTASTSASTSARRSASGGAHEAPDIPPVKPDGEPSPDVAPEDTPGDLLATTARGELRYLREPVTRDGRELTPGIYFAPTHGTRLVCLLSARVDVEAVDASEARARRSQLAVTLHPASPASSPTIRRTWARDEVTSGEAFDALLGAVAIMPSGRAEYDQTWKALMALASLASETRPTIRRRYVERLGWHDGAWVSVNGAIDASGAHLDAGMVAGAPETWPQRLPLALDALPATVSADVLRRLLHFWPDSVTRFPYAALGACAAVSHPASGGRMRWELELFGDSDWLKTTFINWTLRAFYGAGYSYGTGTQLTNGVHARDTGLGRSLTRAMLAYHAYLDTDYSQKPNQPRYEVQQEERIASLMASGNEDSGGAKSSRDGRLEMRPDPQGLLIRAGEPNPYLYSVRQGAWSADARAVTYRLAGVASATRAARLATSQWLAANASALDRLAVLYRQWLASFSVEDARAQWSNTRREALALAAQVADREDADGVTHTRLTMEQLPDMLAGLLLYADFLCAVDAATGAYARVVDGGAALAAELLTALDGLATERIHAMRALALEYERVQGGVTPEHALATALCDAIREGLVGGAYYLTAPDGGLPALAGETGVTLAAMGYAALTFDGVTTWRPRNQARPLAYLSGDGERLACDRHVLELLAREASQHDRRISYTTLTGVLERLRAVGAIVCSPGRLTHAEWVPDRGTDFTRVAFPVAAIWPDALAGDTGGEGGAVGASSPMPDGGAPAVELAATLADALADGAPYSPDTVTYAPGSDAEDGRERVGWGDEDADAAPYAPPSDTPDDPPDSGALAPVGLADTSHDPPMPYQKRYKPSELAADGTPYALMPRTESGVIE